MLLTTKEEFEAYCRKVGLYNDPDPNYRPGWFTTFKNENSYGLTWNEQRDGQHLEFCDDEYAVHFIPTTERIDAFKILFQ